MAQVDRIIIRFDIVGGKEAQLMLSQISKLLVGIGPAAAKGKAGVTAFAQATGMGATAVNKLGTSIDNNIIKISEFAVVIFALVGAYNILVKPVVEVNKNMKIVESVSHATTQELKALKDEALRLGTIFPGGAAKATAALVAIGQAGFDTRQSMQLMEPVFKLATIGAVDYADSVELMIATLNAFHKPVSESAQVVDTLSASISHTLTTFDTFKVALPALSSLASDLGISFEEVVVLLGFLRDRGIPASRTATALKNVFTELTRETGELSKKLQGTGLETEDFDIKARGLEAVLTSVAEAELDVGRKLDLLGLRGIYASSVLDTEVISSLWELKTALEESGESAFQSGVLLESTASKWGQLSGEIGRALEGTFEPMLDVLNKAVDWLKKFVRALGAAPTWVQALTRWIIGLTVAFTALSILIKANILLFYNFIYKQGIAAAIPIIARLVQSFKVAGVVLAAFRAGLMTTTAAAAGLWAMLGPIGWSILAVGSAILAVKAGMNSYEMSIKGQTNALEEDIRLHETKMQTLRGFKTRLEDSAKAYESSKAKIEEYNKANKDATQELKKAEKANLEFKGVLLEIIREFPELLGMQGGLELFWSSMETGIDSVSGAMDTLVTKLDAMNEMLTALEDAKWLASLTAAIGLEPFTMKDKAVRGLTFNELASLTKEEQKEYQFSKGAYFYKTLPEAGKGQEFERAMSSALHEWYLKFRQTREPAISELTGSARGLMENFAAHIQDIQKEELESFVNALEESGLTQEKIIDVLNLLTQREFRKVADELFGEGLAGGDGTVKDKGKGKPDKFVVPELKEFQQAMSKMRADFALENTQYKLELIKQGVGELTIEKSINAEKQIQVKFELDKLSNYIQSLGVVRDELSQLKQTKEVRENIEKIDDARIKLEINRIGLQIKSNDLLDKERDITEKMIEKGAEFLHDRLEKGAEWAKQLKEALDTVGRLKKAEEELANIRKFGRMRGETEEEIVESQLKFVEKQIEDLTRTIDNLKTLFGSLGDFAIAWLEKVGNRALGGLKQLREDLAAELKAVREQKTKREIYETTKESVQNAIKDALLSGDVKDAIEAFADLIKNAVAEKLAEQIADKLVGFVNAFSVFQGGGTKGFVGKGGRTAQQHADVTSFATGGAQAAAGIGAGGGAAAMGWIGVGLMAMSFLSSVFDKDKIDKLDTKLDYILRGSGYQLPSSFLLPEDEGEFSLRRKGRDGFNVRFPKRSLDIQIRHKFEWEPEALAKAVGSDMSVGGMSSVKQYSAIGGE